MYKGQSSFLRPFRWSMEQELVFNPATSHFTKFFFKKAFSMTIFQFSNHKMKLKIIFLSRNCYFHLFSL